MSLMPHFPLAEKQSRNGCPVCGSLLVASNRMLTSSSQMLKALNVPWKSRSRWASGRVRSAAQMSVIEGAGSQHWRHPVCMPLGPQMAANDSQSHLLSCPRHQEREKKTDPFLMGYKYFPLVYDWPSLGHVPPLSRPVRPPEECHALIAFDQLGSIS